MKRVSNPDAVKQWGYYDQRLGKGFTGTKDHIVMQVQKSYIDAGMDFRTEEIPALVENYMCEQKLASPCSERIEGLGDLIHIAALPIARAMDTLFGTKYAMECKSCGQRRQALNEAVPL